MNRLSKTAVSWVEIDESSHGQRIDNFLVKTLKGVPRSHVYRILRSGEVRVNSGRVQAMYRLAVGDRVRIPPVRVAKRTESGSRTGNGSNSGKLAAVPLFEDETLLAINKPSGLAVHGGSGVSMGVIEQLRLDRPEGRFLELVHRLDRDTSGVLLLAKRRSALTALHAQLRDGAVRKRYLVLVLGKWRNKRQSVRLKLHKYVTGMGERRVRVDDQGSHALTIFSLKQQFDDSSLLEAELKTGRTHQIRVHLAHLGFPIAGDDKYGDFAANKLLEQHGLRRMFLHATSLTFRHPRSGDSVTIDSPLPTELVGFLESRKVRHRA